MEPINKAFNDACIYIASRIFPLGFDVYHNAPNSFEDLRATMERENRMAIWSGVPDETSGFGDAETWRQFRAWHDWIHYRFNCAFDLLGEHKACHVQAAQLRRLYGTGDNVAEFVALVFQAILDPLEYEAAGRPIACGYTFARANWRRWLPYARDVVASMGATDVDALKYADSAYERRSKHGPRVPTRETVYAYRYCDIGNDQPSLFA